METKHLSRRINSKTYNKLEKYCKKKNVSITSVVTSSIDNYLLKANEEFTVEQATYLNAFMALKAITLSDEEYKEKKEKLYNQGLKNLTTFKNLK